MEWSDMWGTWWVWMARLQTEKIQIVKDFSKPRIHESWWGFLWHGRFYRIFNMNVRRVACPMYILKSPYVTFIWTEQCQKAFKRLKVALISTLIWPLYDLWLPCFFHTNAFNQVLGQSWFWGGKDQLMKWYSSHTFLPTKMRNQ